MSLDEETQALPGIHKRLTALEKSASALPGISTRLDALEDSHIYANRLIEGMRQDMASVTGTMRRIEQTFSTYEPFLKQSIESQKFWSGVRDECIKHTSKSLLLAVIIAVIAAVWLGVKVAAKEWFNNG